MRIWDTVVPLASFVNVITTKDERRVRFRTRQLSVHSASMQGLAEGPDC